MRLAEAATPEAVTGRAARDTPAAGPVVLKFGSSVLRGPEDLPAVVTEIYAHVRDGAPVVAVVSAFAGETDRLIAEAAAFGADAASRHAPRLIALGEERAAALLAIACDQVGLSARVLGARNLDLRAGGPPHDAFPDRIDATVLRQALTLHDVAIIPGFVALAASGEPVLLGRGGSDLTAAVVASALGAPHVTLMKDVDGVYTEDPNRSDAAQRYETLGWDEARGVAGKLLQVKAIDFAEARGVPIRVARLGGVEASLVGNFTASFQPARPRAALRVALAGLGVVGEGAALRLTRDDARFELVSILISDASKPRDRQLNPALLTTRAETLLAAEPDIVIDALSDGPAGAALIEAALEAGVSVVTANKQAIAGRLAAFTALAEKTDAAFCYSAAVGGGAPMVETVRRARLEGEVVAIDAVLNGTVNYILNRLQRGDAFEEALAAAQDAGFAETDPSADLSGADAVAKLSVLAFEAFGAEPAAGAVALQALDPDLIAKILAEGGVWRQVSRLARTGDGTVTARLAFERAESDPFFASLDNEANALRVKTRDDAAIVCRGRGAGRIPTVESILADLGAIDRGRF